MGNDIRHKRSATPSAIPVVGDLELGELAVNTYDGKLFIKIDDGTESIVEIGGGGGDVTKVGTQAAEHIAVWASDGTLGGGSGFKYSSTFFQVDSTLIITSALLINGASIAPYITDDVGGIGSNTARFKDAFFGRRLRIRGQPIFEMKYEAVALNTDSSAWQTIAGNISSGPDKWGTLIHGIVDDSYSNLSIYHRIYRNQTADVGANIYVERQEFTAQDLITFDTALVDLGTMRFDADQVVGAGQDDFVLTYDNGTGLISLEAAGSGNFVTSDAEDIITTGVTNGAALSITETTITTGIALSVNLNGAAGTGVGVYVSNGGFGQDPTLLYLTQSATATNPATGEKIIYRGGEWVSN